MRALACAVYTAMWLSGYVVVQERECPRASLRPAVYITVHTHDITCGII